MNDQKEKDVKEKEPEQSAETSQDTMDEKDKDPKEEEPEQSAETSQDTMDEKDKDPKEEGTEEVQENSDDTLDQEEKELLEQLMERVESAGILDEELNSDISTFSERVDEVVDTVDRIENIEKKQLERSIFVGKDEEAPSEEQASATMPTLDITGSHIYIPSPTPYKEVSDGEFHPDQESDLISYYGSEAAGILTNIRTLIDIKLSKDEMEEAKNLFELASSIGGRSQEFDRVFGEIMEKMGLKRPSDEQEEPEAPQEKKTKVLDPELADGIDILEKKSRSAIEQLNRMLENSEISDEGKKKVREQYDEALEIFREKRFHKAHQVALEGLESIRNHVQDELDNKIQDNLYRSREMLEKLEKEEKLEDMELLDELKKDIDQAEKSYLTNNYEKANILSKKVMSKIFDLTEPDGLEIKDKLNLFRQELERIREKNILHEEIADIATILRSAESLFKRRDVSNANKLADQLKNEIDDLKEKADIYTRAKEMEIKLNNRVARIDIKGHKKESVMKKLSFMSDYLQKGRFEDVLVIGEELEAELSSLENVRKEMEAKTIFEELESLMTHSEELEDRDFFNERFSKIKGSYLGGNYDIVKEEGEPLVQELRTRSKTLKVERVRRIANGIIDCKVLMSKMKNLNLDHTPYERKIRKIKSLLREGSRTEGLKQMDQAIEDMRSEVQSHIDSMKKMVNIYRDSLEVLMERHREQPVIFHIKRRHIPIISKMEELGRYKSAISTYEKMGEKFSDVALPEDMRSQIETDLTECKFEIYKRKEQGLDISEPLNLYTTAQKKFSSGEFVPAEYLVEVSKRYCEQIIPLAA